MTPISPLFPQASTAANAAAVTGAPKADADFESFLTLLTAQLRNQDPLQPIDSTQFVAQLASFSSVEQLVGVNERLDTLLGGGEAGNAAALVGWIGREVSASDGRLTVPAGAVSFPVPTVTGTERVEAVIAAADGTERARFTVATDASGQAQWDGLDAEGRSLAGEAVTLTLRHLAGERVISEGPAEIYRQVTGIAGSAFGPVLRLADGAELPLASIGAVREAG